MRTIVTVLVLAPLLVGCATSAAGLQRMGVEMTVSSQRTAQAFATCYAEHIQGQAELRGSGNHWWVLRANGVGVPIVRWDFRDLSTGGSIAELRATAIAGAAKDKLQVCSRQS